MTEDTISARSFPKRYVQVQSAVAVSQWRD
jgi:hypothetical protein